MFFCDTAFTDSFSFSPAPHPPVWPSPHPTQSLTQRAMLPSHFPMECDSYSVEQQQGVYVCVFMWWGEMCMCNVLDMMM